MDENYLKRATLLSATVGSDYVKFLIHTALFSNDIAT